MNAMKSEVPKDEEEQTVVPMRDYDHAANKFAQGLYEKFEIPYITQANGRVVEYNSTPEGIVAVEAAKKEAQKAAQAVTDQKFKDKAKYWENTGI